MKMCRAFSILDLRWTVLTTTLLKCINICFEAISRTRTHRLGRVANAPGSFTGHSGFRSEPRLRLSSMRFLVVFTSPSGQMLG